MNKFIQGLMTIRYILSAAVAALTAVLLQIRTSNTLPPIQPVEAVKIVVGLMSQKPTIEVNPLYVRPPVDVNTVYTQMDIDMIAAVVMHEVGYCSRESKIAVTNVILNRLHDGRFGDTIAEILHAPGQFGAIHNYYDHEIEPDGDCYEAVKSALAGEDNTNGAVYYCNPDYVYDEAIAEWFGTLEVVAEIDGQLFYR